MGHPQFRRFIPRLIHRRAAEICCGASHNADMTETAGVDELADERRTLYVSLARGGSKRLPGKNLRCVGGVPLVGRAVRDGLQAARRMGNPARVVVSTDDEAIAQAAVAWGAEVPFVRPAELATDAADSVAGLRHTVDWFAERGETFAEVVLLQPTSPLREASDVVRAVEEFRRGDGAPVVTVRRVAHPLTRNVSRGGEPTPGGCPIPAKQGWGSILQLATSPPLPTEGMGHPANGAGHVELNGAVYVCSPQWLSKSESLYVPGRTLTVMMPTERSIDVDTTADLQRAEALWEQSLLWQPGRCLIIAEAGVNHNGSLETALRLVEAAREAGADVVKFQTFAAERLVPRSAAKAAYQRQTTATDESQFEMLKKLELSPEQLRKLMAHCAEQGILFLASPFSERDVDLLDSMDVPAIKVGSGEITNHPLLAHVGATFRPVILSTGCSSLDEVTRAVDVLREAGCVELALLHCVSNYPADPADVNLRAMETMARAFNLPVGYSDHTPEAEIACAAVALGARIIEKHLTLDRTMSGPDHRASLEPREFAGLVSSIRHIESAMGDGVKRPAPSEADVRTAARRSLVAATDLPVGTMLRRAHLVAKRPGTGVSPAELENILGLRLQQDLAADDVLTWAHLRGAGDG